VPKNRRNYGDSLVKCRHWSACSQESTTSTSGGSSTPEGYQYLKNNWGKGIFKIPVYYSDKQELKTVVNRLINVGLKRNEK